MQNVKCLVLTLNLVAFSFFSPGLVGYGCAHISFSSSRGGFTHSHWFHYFPGLSFIPNLQKAVKYLERGWDVMAVAVLSSPCSTQRRNADEHPHNWCHQSNEPGQVQRIPRVVVVGKMNSSEGCGAQQYLKPQGSDQVLRKWAHNLRLA